MAGTNDGIFIEGKVNAYIGGSIQTQGNGIGGLADGVVVTGDIGTNGTGNSVLTNDTSLAAGVYKNGAGLTSVDNTGQHVTKPEPNNTVNNPNPTINLFGGKVNSSGSVASNTQYGYSVGPANVQVKLTLVSAANNNSSSKN